MCAANTTLLAKSNVLDSALVVVFFTLQCKAWPKNQYIFVCLRPVVQDILVGGPDLAEKVLFQVGGRISSEVPLFVPHCFVK